MGTRAHRSHKASKLVAMLGGVTYLLSGVLHAALDPRIRLTGSVGLGR